jgi:hypothetical protein
LRAVVGSSTLFPLHVAPAAPPDFCIVTRAHLDHLCAARVRQTLRTNNLSDHDHNHDHASIELTASVCAWQPKLSQNSPSSPVTHLPARSLRRGFLHTGGIQTTFLDAPHCTTTGHNLLNELCGLARLFPTAQDGVGRS